MQNNLIKENSKVDIINFIDGNGIVCNIDGYKFTGTHDNSLGTQLFFRSPTNLSTANENEIDNDNEDEFDNENVDDDGNEDEENEETKDKDTKTFEEDRNKNNFAYVNGNAMNDINDNDINSSSGKGSHEDIFVGKTERIVCMKLKHVQG